jgi:hypothetical protein
VVDICVHLKFGGRRQRDTPVADAAGITTIIMLPPGHAAAVIRQAAASVLVRYLGGDTSLDDEIQANREVQSRLEPEHPAAFFGQSITAVQTPIEIATARNLHLEGLRLAVLLAQSVGSTSLGRLQAEVQKALDSFCLPLGDTLDQYIDPAMILRERGHSEGQIARLAGELGRDMKFMTEQENLVRHSGSSILDTDSTESASSIAYATPD